MIDYTEQYELPEGWSIEPIGTNRLHMWQTGDEDLASITYYGIAPGVWLLDIELHCFDLPVFRAPMDEFLTVNWCAQGRCEAASTQRGSTVVDPGLICLSTELATTYSYPIGTYRGYELVVDLAAAQEDPSEPFSAFGIDLRKLARTLCKSLFALTIEPPAVCRHALAAIADLLDEPDPNHQELLLATCLLLADLRHVDPASSRLTSTYLQKSQRDLAQQLHDALVRNPGDVSAIKSLALTSGASEASLRSYFARMYGVTPAAFARAHILDRATELLAQTDQSISTIALACGYSNPSKFSAAFRKAFDTNPLNTAAAAE